MQSLLQLASHKRSAVCGPEDLTPEAKRSCIDEAIKKMVEVQQGKKMAGLELAAKNMHKSLAELGLHPEGSRERDQGALWQRRSARPSSMAPSS